MATSQHWICFECAQATHPSQPFFECTFCRIRVCPSCIARHPQSHNRCIVRLQKVPLNEAFNSTQTCVTCGDIVTLRYSCQQCYYAQCRPCWHAGGVTRHEHKAMNLFEVREDYQGSRPPSWPSRPGSTPIAMSPSSPGPPMPALHHFHTQPLPPGLPAPMLRQIQTQPSYLGHPAHVSRQIQYQPSQPGPPSPMSRQTQYQPISFDPPPANYSQPPQKKRHSITRGLKKGYAMTQKNALTKVATVIAVGTVSAVVGADLTGLVAGIDAIDLGGGDVDVPTAVDVDTGMDNQGFGDPGTSALGNTQDFSNLQNGSAETTAWMQQQYLQNITLPYLAGPTMTPAMMDPTC